MPLEQIANSLPLRMRYTIGGLAKTGLADVVLYLYRSNDGGADTLVRAKVTAHNPHD